MQQRWWISNAVEADVVLVSLTGAIEDLYGVSCQRTIWSLFKDYTKGREKVCNHTLQFQIKYVWYQDWAVTRHSSNNIKSVSDTLSTTCILNIAGSPEKHIHQMFVTFSTNFEKHTALCVCNKCFTSICTSGRFLIVVGNLSKLDVELKGEEDCCVKWPYVMINLPTRQSNVSIQDKWSEYVSYLNWYTESH